ncbi:MAG: DUF4404 family protein [Verrucomicrobiae bacterium]|nr:DUF4404 family protein [Verrucomicrobiae bacterium]MDW8309210.1 DUF4404 family protein [Verrucomicrobiales bacterium]
MVDETLAKIEARIRASDSLGDERKGELLALLGQLRREVGALPPAHAEQARSITGFTDVSAHEATRERRNPRLLRHAIEGLRASVTEFEGSHPNLVRIVNSICNTLSGLGI